MSGLDLDAIEARIGDELEDVGDDFGPGLHLSEPEAIQLIAAARELEELRGAILFMNERGYWQNTTPAVIVQRAKDFGWKPEKDAG